MIVRWEQGRTVIDALLKQGRLTGVAPNRALADSMLIQARAHLAASVIVIGLDPQGAFSLTYDAARKALAAILVNHGLRAGRQGAHAALLEAVLAQLDPPSAASSTSPATTLCSPASAGMSCDRRNSHTRGDLGVGHALPSQQ